MELTSKVAFDLYAERAPTVGWRLLEVATRVVPCDFAGLTAFPARGGMVAVSDPVVGEADRLQTEYGEGPRFLPSGVDAAMRIVDTATDPRWPRWGQQVAALGLRSMLCVELSARSAGLGALVLYSPIPDRFGPSEQEAARTLARHISVAVATRRNPSRFRQFQDLRRPAGGIAGC